MFIIILNNTNLIYNIFEYNSNFQPVFNSLIIYKLNLYMNKNNINKVCDYVKLNSPILKDLFFFLRKN